MIFFSVIMPVYNRAELVSSAIRSVLDQSYAHFELICVNDGSNDHTLRVLEEFACKDSRVVVIDCKINRGRSAARNTALWQARGEWICFLDSDDIYFCNHLAEHADLINTRPEFNCFATEQLIYGRARKFPFRFDEMEKTISLEHMVNANFISLNQIALKRRLAPLFLPVTISHSEDLLFVRRILEKTDILLVRVVTTDVIFHKMRSTIADDIVHITNNNWAAAVAFCRERKRAANNRILSYTALFCASRLITNRKARRSLTFFKIALQFKQTYFSLLFFKVLAKYVMSIIR